MNNTQKPESVAEQYISAYINPYRPRNLAITAICSLLSVIPVIQAVAAAFAFSPNRRDIPAKTGKIIGVSLLMFSPPLMYFISYMLLLKLPVVLLYIPHYLLIALMVITGISATIQYPVALMHVCHGGSLREALDKRFIKTLIGASVGRYIAACLGLLPIPLVMAFDLFVPQWLALIGAVLLIGLLYFVIGRLFGAHYRAAMSICGFDVPEGADEHDKGALRPHAAVALALVFIILCQPLSAYAITPFEYRSNGGFGPKVYLEKDFQGIGFQWKQPVFGVDRPPEQTREYAIQRDRMIRLGQLKPGEQLNYSIMNFNGAEIQLFQVANTQKIINKSAQTTAAIAEAGVGFIPIVGNVWSGMKAFKYQSDIWKEEQNKKNVNLSPERVTECDIKIQQLTSDRNWELGGLAFAGLSKIAKLFKAGPQRLSKWFSERNLKNAEKASIDGQKSFAELSEMVIKGEKRAENLERFTEGGRKIIEVGGDGLNKVHGFTGMGVDAVKDALKDKPDPDNPAKYPSYGPKEGDQYGDTSTLIDAMYGTYTGDLYYSGDLYNLKFGDYVATVEWDPGTIIVVVDQTGTLSLKGNLYLESDQSGYGFEAKSVSNTPIFVSGIFLDYDPEGSYYYKRFQTNTITTNTTTFNMTYLDKLPALGIPDLGSNQPTAEGTDQTASPGNATIYLTLSVEEENGQKVLRLIGNIGLTYQYPDPSTYGETMLDFTYEFDFSLYRESTSTVHLQAN